MKREDVIRKIQKCLRMARSTNPEQAAIALRQAQKLMEEHQLTETEIAAAEAEEASAKSSSSDKPVLWEVMLARMIADVFGCDMIFSPRWNRDKWQLEGGYTYVGVDGHAEIAAYAFSVLRRQAANARREYAKQALKRCSPSAKIKRSDQFSDGWVHAARRQAVALAPTVRATSAIAAYMAVHFPETTSLATRQRPGTPLAHRDRAFGYEEGSKAQLRPGVGSVAPAGLLE